MQKLLMIKCQEYTYTNNTNSYYTLDELPLIDGALSDGWKIVSITPAAGSGTDMNLAVAWFAILLEK